MSPEVAGATRCARAVPEWRRGLHELVFLACGPLKLARLQARLRVASACRSPIIGPTGDPPPRWSSGSRRTKANREPAVSPRPASPISDSSRPHRGFARRADRALRLHALREVLSQREASSPLSAFRWDLHSASVASSPVPLVAGAARPPARKAPACGEPPGQAPGQGPVRRCGSGGFPRLGRRPPAQAPDQAAPATWLGRHPRLAPAPAAVPLASSVVMATSVLLRQV